MPEPRWKAFLSEYATKHASPVAREMALRLLDELTPLVPDTAPLPCMGFVEGPQLVAEWRLSSDLCAEAIALAGEPTEVFVRDASGMSYDVLPALAERFKAVFLSD